MAIEESLKFLEKQKTIYYAGLDHESLPFGEGERLILRTAHEQTVYLKALSLVSDYIVVPPSFYFFWVHMHKDAMLVEELLELYHAGIVLSPIYASMNMGTDFLEKKLEQGSSSDKFLIKENSKLLRPFFRSMPVTHRDVRKQSAGFRDFLVNEIPQLNGPSILRKRFDNLLFSPIDREVLVSREQMEDHLLEALNTEKIGSRHFRRYYYTINKCYYRQGGMTYDATISLVGAERYSILGTELFLEQNGILLGYDPIVIIGILEALGIGKELLNNLSVNDLIEIRKSPAFTSFRDAYNDFSIELQRLELSIRNVSKRVIEDCKRKLERRFLRRYFNEFHKYQRYSKVWNIGEMSLFSLALGAVGFFVVPIVGALLGLVPIVVYAFDITPRLSDLVITRLCEQEIPFYTFINELRRINEALWDSQEI